MALKRSLREVAIEGPHGVGKTAVLHRLASTVDGVNVVDEIVLEGLAELVDAFGQGAFLLNDLLRLAQGRIAGQPCFFDRSVVSTYIYNLAERGPREADDVLAIVDQCVKAGLLAPPDVLIVLMADVSVLVERLRARGESPDRQYLERQVGAYRAFLADAPAQTILGHPQVIELRPEESVDEVSGKIVELLSQGTKPHHEAEAF